MTQLRSYLEDSGEETEAEREEIRQAFKEGEAEMKARTLYSLDDIIERASQILASSDKFKASKSV